MRGRFLSRKTSGVTGVAISEKTLRLLEMDGAAEGVRVRAAACVPLDEPAAEQTGGSEGVMDWKRLCIRAREALSQGGFRQRRAVVCLPWSVMGYRRLRLAAIPENELGAAVHWRAAKELSMSVTAFESGYYDVGLVREQGRHHRDVIAVTAASSDICGAVDALQDAGLEVQAVDAAAGALAAVLFAHAPEHLPTLVVEIGVRSSAVMVVCRSRPCFIRTIPGGRAQMVQRAASRLGLKQGEHEALWRLLDGGACGDGPGVGGHDDEKVLMTLCDVAALHAAELAHEVVLCSHYMAGLGTDLTPRQGCIVGAGAQEEIFLSCIKDSADMAFLPLEALLDVRLSMALDGIGRDGLIDAWLVAAGLCSYTRGTWAKEACA